MRRSSALILFAVVILSSCLKTKSNSNTNNPASIAIINLAAVATPPPFNFKVTVDDDSVGDQSTFPYAGYQTNADSSLKYLQEYAGIHSIAFTTSGASDSILVSGQTQFTKGFKYSIFLYDTINSYGLNAVQLQDTWDSIPYNQCLFRFLNFSPNAPPLTVLVHYFNDTLVQILQNQAYVGSASYSTASLSQYLTLPPTGYVDSCMVTLSTYKGYGMKPGPALDSFNIALIPNHGYTLFITGLVGDTTGRGYRHGLIRMN